MANSLEESFDTSSWDPVDPGWGFDELADIDPTDLGEGGKLAALQAVAQAESILRAKRLELMRAYRQHKHGQPDVEWVADRLAAKLNITIARAAGELTMADGLACLPRTFAALAAGTLDQHRARQIVDATQNLTDERRQALEERIYPRAATKTPRQLADLLRREIILLDPDAANKRAQAAKKDRRVAIEPAADGMGWLNAFLKAEDVCAIYQRIDHLARLLNTRDESRSMDQLRADVLRDLLLGKLDAGGVVTHVYVTANATTLLGLDELPGDLRGYGPLPAERIRELAYQLKTTWSGVLVDNEGYPKKLADKRYRFQGKLAEFIRLRDGTCSHAACNRVADKCDIDHAEPWPEGTTSAENGNSGCRRHHREKTEIGWTIHREGHTVIWTHPDGTTQIKHQQPLAPPGNDPPPF